MSSIENAVAAEPTEVNSEQEQGRNVSEQLREETVAVRLRKTRLGTTRRLTSDQSRRQAEAFHADPTYLKGRKKLLDTSHEKVRACNSIISTAREYWTSVTVPYPDRGLRLLRRDRLEEFDAAISELQASLATAADELDAIYRDEIIPEARERLGDLFDPRDYADSTAGAWSIEYELENIEPPDYLRQLNPRLYEQEQARAAARLDEAVRLTEAAFAEELSKAVAGLIDRLTPQEVNTYRYDGPKLLELDRQAHELTKLASDLRDRLVRVENDMAMSLDLIDQETGETLNAEELEQRLGMIEQDLALIDRRRSYAEATAIERRDKKLRLCYPKDAAKRRVTRSFESVEELRLELRDVGCSHVSTTHEEKTVQGANVSRLSDFFERFRELNIGSNEELENLVDQAQQAVSGIDVEVIRSANNEERAGYRTPLAEIADKLEEMLVDRPHREITLDDDE